VKDKVDGADGDDPLMPEVEAHGKGQGVAQGKEDNRRGPHGRAPEGGLLVAAQPLSSNLVEAPHDKARGAIGADVLPARKVLLQEAKEGGALLADGPKIGDGDIADLDQDHQGNHGVGGKGGAQAPVLEEEQDQHTKDQDGVGPKVNDEAGEEPAEGIHIAVNPLHKLPRAVDLVKGHVQREAVGGNIGPQVVGGGPTHILAQVARIGADGVVGKGDGNEDGSQVGQPVGGHPSRDLVDECPQDLGSVELQPD